jgi:hypothetical protein
LSVDEATIREDDADDPALPHDQIGDLPCDRPYTRLSKEVLGRLKIKLSIILGPR